ncbi:MAG: hypothetical protein CMB99_12105 [Flavobacteriaceae bacterium]|nr:hypothetical protein [Flavobacteriaceae bacterium]|tara:strand:- start:131715 stop:132722 length:1008 start_codon:yes stop_codon:yes gene_type:complete
MKRFFSIFVFMSLLIYSCGNTEIDLPDDNPTNTTSCPVSDITIFPGDSIAVNSLTNPIYWEGTFTDTTVEVHFTEVVDSNGETETLFFVFEKNECLEIDRVFKYYDGKNFDTTNITEAEVLDFGIQDWTEDELISGFVTYIDPHDKRTYSRKFRTRLFAKLPTTPLSFNDCIGQKLPIEIDLNSDGVADFSFDVETIEDVGNKPTYNEYKVVLKSNSNNNEILSPIRNSEPYFVVFEPPFSSQNTQQYFGGVKKALDIFYEFEAPYEEYNLFLNNNLTYSEILNNNLPDYYLVSMVINGELYYGYIGFRFSSTDCRLNVLDKYLHNVPFEHIQVN